MRKRLFLTALLTCLATAPMPDARAVLVDRIVATVDQRVVTWSELDEYRLLFFPELPENRALIRLIDDVLILEEARRYEVEVADAQVSSAIAAIQSRLGPVLTRLGISDSELRRRVRDRLLVDAFLRYRFENWVRVTEEAVQSAYEKGRYEQPFAAVKAEIRARLEREAYESRVQDYMAELHNRVSLQSFLERTPTGPQ